MQVKCWGFKGIYQIKYERKGKSKAAHEIMVGADDISHALQILQKITGEHDVKDIKKFDRTQFAMQDPPTQAWRI